MNNSVLLKKGKEKALKNKHHWIFSGAIESLPEFENGSLLIVLSSTKEKIGTAYFNKHAKIIGRMLAFGEDDPYLTLKKSIFKAIELRQSLFNPKNTTAFRLINGEGDLLPGLIVDQYNNILVLQITTLGMEKLKEQVVSILSDLLKPQTIYEKSIVPARKEEKLQEIEQTLFGTLENPIILENKLKFQVSIDKGQKTGFFLDHREMRAKIGTLSQGKKVLNCFSYTGGFSVYAAAGGAKSVHSVDISPSALEIAKQNFLLNNLKGDFTCADVFQFLREEPLDYDIVILDPPAFAKKQKDIIPACRGYKDINRIAMKKMPPKSLLLTCSCSYFVDDDLFQKVLFQAAVEAQREVKIIGIHQLAPDHPINICHPESDYLKSRLLYIN